MGLQISEIIPRKEIEISELKGKTVAIDAFNTLYQFLTTIRQIDGTPLMDKKGNITSHLSGLFYRNINLLAEGIKPVYVFDGIPPELKNQEIEKRQEAKKIADEFYNKAKAEGNIKDMKKYSRQNVKLSNEIISQSKELLEAMGIPVIQAPGEGEAEAAAIAKTGKVWASASQDYDSLLYQTPYLIRNLTLSRKRKTSAGLFIEVKPELIDLQQVFNKLQIDLEQLICLAILVGTDYNPGGVKGLGQKRAIEIVQRYKIPFEIFKHVQQKYECFFDWQKIFSQFKEYQVATNINIEFKPMNPDKIKEILLLHDFSEERIGTGIKKLQEYQDSQKQKPLKDFLG